MWWPKGQAKPTRNSKNVILIMLENVIYYNYLVYTKIEISRNKFPKYFRNFRTHFWKLYTSQHLRQEVHLHLLNAQEHNTPKRARFLNGHTYYDCPIFPWNNEICHKVTKSRYFGCERNSWCICLCGLFFIFGALYLTFFTNFLCIFLITLIMSHD